jgi:type IV pilus assembly protein PilB
MPINGNERKPLGDLLLDSELITPEILSEALAASRASGKRLGETLVEMGALTEQKLLEVLEFQLRIPLVSLSKIEIDPQVPLLINEAMARRYQCVPIALESSQLTLAMADPLNLQATDDIRIFTGMSVKPVFALKNEIATTIDRFYSKEGAEKAVEDFKKDFDIEQFTEAETEQLSDIDNAPVVRLINSIIQHAIRSRASDIHIEPFEKFLRFRFRVDGEMQEVMRSSRAAHSAVTTRIKIMGKMDLAEKRVPQDGRVGDDPGRSGYRHAYLGAPHGLRGKDRDPPFGPQRPGHDQGAARVYRGKHHPVRQDHQEHQRDHPRHRPDRQRQDHDPVRGPPGAQQDQPQHHHGRGPGRVPAGRRQSGAGQHQSGMTFANGLRSILRQDPDIIMIGEIRDAETAQIAVRAAITGHLVLSTMHTNDSASTVSRIVDMGVEPYLVSSSLVGVTAQRLLRRICPNCKTAYTPDRAEMDILRIREPVTIHKGAGCSACNFTGYRGRIAIHEIMTINSQIRELIDKRASIDHLRNISMRHGTTTLRDNSVKLVLCGGDDG